MRERESDGDVGRPLMQRKDVDVTMRPELYRTVAQRHQQTQQDVDSNRADGSEAEVGAEVERGDGWAQGRSWGE